MITFMSNISIILVWDGGGGGGVFKHLQRTTAKCIWLGPKLDPPPPPHLHMVGGSGWPPWLAGHAWIGDCSACVPTCRFSLDFEED